MAKKKNTPRRVPQTSGGARMYGDGKPSQVETESTAAAGVEARRTESVRPASRPVKSVSRPAAAMRGAPMRYTEPRQQLPLSQEYHYVINDLRRLGIVAVSIFAVLIVLGFVIQ